MTLAFATIQKQFLSGFCISLVIFLVEQNSPVRAFQQSCNVAIRHKNPSNTRIGVSVSSPSEVLSAEGDSQNPFRDHLQELLSQVKAKPFLSFYMDDDLKRMETEFYNLSPEESPKCIKNKSAFSYDGPTVRPDESCYQAVTQAYGMAREGEMGADLAEDVALRYEKHQPESYANRYIMKGVLRAVVNAKNYSKAHNILLRMEDRFSETKDINLAPDTTMYNTLTDGLSQFGCPAERKYCATMTMTILKHMRQKFNSGVNPMAIPNRYTYTHVMQCNSRVGKGVPTFEKLETLYHQLKEDYQRWGYESLKPDALSALPLFQVAVNSRGNYKVLEKAFDIYDELQDLYETTGDEDYAPLESMYKYLFTSAARISYSHAFRIESRVNDLVRSMKRNIQNPSVYTVTTAINAKAIQRNRTSMAEAEEIMRDSGCADAVAYQTLIKGYARLGNAGKALELLDELKDQPGINYLEVSTLGSIIDALSKSSSHNKNASTRKNASLKAEHILNLIVSMYLDGEVVEAETGIDGKVFDSVLRLVGRGRGNAARIVAIIEDMEKLNQLVPGHFAPTSSTYTLAIDGLARCGDPRSAQMVLKILKKIEEPNIRVLASALSCVSRGNMRGVVRKSEDLFQLIIDRYKLGDRSANVNARTLTTILSAMLRAQSPDAPKRAHRFLRQAIELARSGMDSLAPNTICFNVVMNGFARFKQSQDAWSTFEEMKALHSRGYETVPDVITYACVARAVASDSNTDRAVSRIDAVVDEVRNEIENGNLQPDAQLFNTLIKSYTFHSKGEECVVTRANDLLQQLEVTSDVSPDLMTYKIAGEVFAMSRAPNAAALAMEAFHKAEILSRDGIIAPLDSEILSFVILTQTRSSADDAVHRSEDFVHDLEKRYQRLLNTRCYNTLLAAYANSAHEDKVARSREIFEKLVSLQKLGQKNCKPDTSTFNWLILAAANSLSSDAEIDAEKFGFALEHFQKLHAPDASQKPDSLTYEFFLRACHRLLPRGETRTELVGKVLSLCSKRGMVTTEIVSEAAKSDFSTVMERLDTTEQSRKDSIVYIPDDWCHNVPKRRRMKEVHLGHVREHDI
ncbi:unnamed protein product [Cylindrotheca closterium]|uniref:Pentacotripeptide-repeat region of PRORP domain-containing protein n=1 Tax=Cylindrotheca closterium TaxID=2856 RepID=A0AAD2CAZ3_9STRA|nr:unnamed protein product [Cylindrotheca closterium]